MPSFYMMFLFFKLVNMRSIRLKFIENFQLPDAYCNWNNQNLKKMKTIPLFRVFDFVYRAKSKTWKFRKVSFNLNFDSSCNLKYQNDKKLPKTKTERSRYAFRRKNENFWGFHVFDFKIQKWQRWTETKT